MHHAGIGMDELRVCHHNREPGRKYSAGIDTNMRSLVKVSGSDLCDETGTGHGSHTWLMNKACGLTMGRDVLVHPS